MDILECHEAVKDSKFKSLNAEKNYYCREFATFKSHDNRIKRTISDPKIHKFFKIIVIVYVDQIHNQTGFNESYQ